MEDYFGKDNIEDEVLWLCPRQVGVNPALQDYSVENSENDEPE